MRDFRNFDFLFFIVSLLLQILQLISVPLIIAIHFVAFFLKVLNGLKNVLMGLFGGLAAYHSFLAGRALVCWIRYTILANSKRREAQRNLTYASNLLTQAAATAVGPPPQPAAASAIANTAGQAINTAVNLFLEADTLRQTAQGCRQTFFRELRVSANYIGAVLAIKKIVFRLYESKNQSNISTEFNIS